MNPFRPILITIAFSLITTLTFSQNCKIVGKILDQSTGHPIAYANAILTSLNDSTILQGSITDDKGEFVIKNILKGNYKLTLSFIGYQSLQMENLVIQRRVKNIGEIKLSILAKNLDAVTIKGSRIPIRYKVDRKVIDAASFPEANFAMDLLENVPSLQVDFDGKMTYRGDGTFKVFINGQPVVNGVEKLRQIPAERIARIEVITNPSAKYDAEGTAGIIQVILKRNRLPGYAIGVSASTKTLGYVMGNFSIEKQGKKGSWYLNGLINGNTSKKKDYTQLQKTTTDGILHQNILEADEEYTGLGNFLEFGFNYDLSTKDRVDLSINAHPLKSNSKHQETGSVLETTYLANGSLISNNYLYQSMSGMSYRYLGSTFKYEHAFNKKRSHLFSTSITFNTYLHPSLGKNIDTKEYSHSISKLGTLSKEYNEMLLGIDLAYENKISEHSSFEGGLGVSLDHIPKVSSVSGTFDEGNNVTPFPNEPLNQEVDFKQDIYSSYLIFKSKFRKFEYQLGLRMELTDRKSNYEFDKRIDYREKIPFEKQFVDFFPTLHTVYNFSETHQLAASFSRRINRPGYWSLIPFSQYSSIYYYYQGNEKLMPAYSNAFELAYKKSWDKDFIGIELFARNTQGLIQEYSRIDTSPIFIDTPENIGDSWSIGTELMTGVDLLPWWNVNISTSLYLYQLQIDIDNVNKTENQFRYDSRLNNKFQLPKNFVLKWDVKYSSPSITAQKKREGYLYSNVAVKKSLNDNTWIFTISCTNIFNSIKYSVIEEGSNFYIENSYHVKPYITFRIAYNFNNQK